MKKLLIACCLLAGCCAAIAQKAKSKPSPNSQEVRVAMTAGSWEFPAGSAEFITHNNVQALKIVNGSERIKLKDLVFSDGTIEFDIDQPEEPFAGIFFRAADNNEAEYFYLRVARAGNPQIMDAVQYAAFNKGVNLWDLLDHFQGPAKFTKSGWNHIKLVVSGKQMLVYVNDTIPTLEVPYLEGNFDRGGIAFNGKGIIANVTIKHGATEGLPARAGFDPTHHDPRYLRTWQVTDPQPLPKGRELTDLDFPKAGTTWRKLNAERRGLVNLTRLHGVDARRFVWLRATVTSTTDKEREMQLGFSDEVWVFLNRQIIYVDKNIYTSAAMRKSPDGRISLENSSFNIPLRKGDNELLIGVANDFFGWGIVARLDNAEGITVTANYEEPTISPDDLLKFEGTYSSKNFPVKIIIKRQGSQLTAQPTGQQPMLLDYLGKNKFGLTQANVTIEFLVDEKKMIVNEGGSSNTFDRE